MPWASSPIIILGLILSSLSLILNISKYKETTKSRDGMLAQLTDLKYMTSQYLEALEWTTSDLRSRVKQLEEYNKKLLERVISLTKDENFPELNSRAVKTIKMQQSFNWPVSPVVLRIPAEDASLVLFNSPQPQLIPIPFISMKINIIRKDQISWQRKFRVDPVVIKIPFTDWAIVLSAGPKRIRFCADAFLLLASVLPVPIPPFDIIVDKQRKEEILSSGIAPDYVEIGIRISDGDGLPRSPTAFLDAIIKLYPHINKGELPKFNILFDLALSRKLQLIRKNKKEQKRIEPLLETSTKIELETYKKAILRLRTEAELHGNIPSPESLAHVGVAHHYKCSAHLRLQSIDKGGYTIFTVVE